MARTICLYKQVEDSLGELCRGSKKDRIAADRARAIVTALSSAPEVCLHEAGTTTHYGEARFENCVKYDLGKGHRLVCLKDRGGLHFVFLGTHDAVDRWLEINRGSGPERLGKPATVIEVPEPRRREDRDEGSATSEEDADYDEILMSRITEKDLRAVFAGLCGNTDGDK
ncbi:MAG: hypothetical protein AB1921_18870 [Thermodesulfobacteriota bacterium]